MSKIQGVSLILHLSIQSKNDNNKIRGRLATQLTKSKQALSPWWLTWSSFKLDEEDCLLFIDDFFWCDFLLSPLQLEYIGFLIPISIAMALMKSTVNAPEISICTQKFALMVWFHLSILGISEKRAAKSLLFEICTANHWQPPLFECCEEEGPSHAKK